MAIQYGDKSVTDIQYCDASGTLQPVNRVEREGAVVWEREYQGLKFTASALGVCQS